MAAPTLHGVDFSTVQYDSDSESGSSSSSVSSVNKAGSSEELQRLREAALTADDLLHFSKYTKNNRKTSSSTSVSATPADQLKSSLPSKRSAEVNDHEDENTFGTTPEFRAFVSRKLAEKLDREIEFCAIETPASKFVSWVNQDAQVTQQGVRLFSDSTHVLCDADATPTPSSQPQRQQRRKPKILQTGSPHISEEQKLAEAAMTAESLAQEREMWIRLCQNSPETAGKLEVITVVSGNTVNKDDTSHNGTEKKKKKKKNKKKAKIKDSGEIDLVEKDLNPSTEYGSHSVNTNTVTKKKRKRTMNSISLTYNSDGRTGQELRVKDVENRVCGEQEEPVKKKRKKKQETSKDGLANTIESGLSTSEQVTLAKTTSTDNVNCDKLQTKKKKKKKTKHKNSEDGSHRIMESGLSIQTDISSGKTLMDAAGVNHDEHELGEKKKKKKHKNKKD